MPDLVKDFIGLNILVNDPQGDDSKDSSNDALEAGADVSNTVGFDEDPTGYSIDAALQEQQILPILLTHRNGNWGHNTWKQIRNSNNTVVRSEKKYNKISIANDPEIKKVVVGGKIETILFRDLVKRSYNEPCVISKHHPLIVLLSREEFDDQNKRAEFLYALEVSYNNEITFMTNDEVNVHAGVVPIESEDYETLKGLYLKGALEDEESPFSSFRSFIFKQTVFPPEEFTFKSYTRKRINFVSGYWRDNRTNRNVLLPPVPQYGANFYGSMWPLDAPSDFLTRTSIVLGGATQGINLNPGILQNTWVQLNNSPTAQTFDYIAGFYYNRRPPRTPGTSATSTAEGSAENALGAAGHSVKIKQRYIAADSGCQAAQDLVDAFEANTNKPGVLFGEAAWDAPEMSGRNPFDDNIDKFYETMEKKYKDYSIIPEYKINSHIEFYLVNGVKEQNSTLFEVFGGNDSAKTSSDAEFYRVYSNSDFLKNFKILKKEHKDFANPSAISLTCKAVKKFIPYDGFYPAQRTVDIAEQFYSSYKDSIKVANPFFHDETSTTHFFNHVYKPMFSPGIMFNTIKSGIGVDFPLYEIPATDSRISDSFSYYNPILGTTTIGDPLVNLSGSTVENHIKRIPFEALLDPESYLGGTALFLPEVDERHHFSDGAGDTDLTSSVFFSGKPDLKYKSMIHNFLAEVPEFFLKNKDFVKLRSKKQSDASFGFMEEGKEYRMRLRTYKTFKTKPDLLNWANTGSVGKYVSLPQSLNDIGLTASMESLTMYSRPSAFGVEEGRIDGNTQQAISDISPLYLNYWQTTPPYYHGEGWTDFLFTPTESRKHTVSEIISGSVLEHYRFNLPRIVNATNSVGSETTKQALARITTAEATINKIAMNNDSCYNLFVRENDDVGQDTVRQDQDYLVIQAKFETPILNFNHIETSSMSLPSLDGGLVTTPIGMWHQFGNLPENNEGVFCQITDVPFSFLYSNAARSLTQLAADGTYSWDNEEVDLSLQKLINQKHRSLADVLGFSKSPARLGEVAKVKKIKEAVVAVPFHEKNGVKKFFPIPRKDINNAVAGNSKLCGQSVIEMVDKMRQYNFPPSMDFLNYNEVDPFAMYIFEFEHDLTQQDLSYIWQNLAPDIALSHEEATATITHELLAHELLGEGAVITTTEEGAVLNESAKGKEFEENIRWMVFKVKFRAKTNYYKKIVGKKDTIGKSRGIGPSGDDNLITYNWPYDFFSLVELVKLDASVEFSNIERDEKTKERVVKDIKPKPTTSKERESSNPRKVIKRK
ncbi:hypothetical protein N8467_00355 [bacterium]|nr:hypothetical protein [bacterium]